MDGQIDTQLK
jgi:hypothetical protein